MDKEKGLAGLRSREYIWREKEQDVYNMKERPS